MTWNFLLDEHHEYGMKMDETLSIVTGRGISQGSAMGHMMVRFIGKLKPNQETKNQWVPCSRDT
jgi:hypothetical protein